MRLLRGCGEAGQVLALGAQDLEGGGEKVPELRVYTTQLGIRVYTTLLGIRVYTTLLGIRVYTTLLGQ